MTRRPSIRDVPLPPVVQEQVNAAGLQVADHIRRHMSAEFQDSLNRVGKRFLTTIREHWVTVEKMDAARTHADPDVRAAWQLPERYDFSLDDADLFARGQKDPRKRPGRPPGEQAPEVKRQLVRELVDRLKRGDKQADIVNDLAPRWPAASLDAAKAALRAEARAHTDIK